MLIATNVLNKIEMDKHLQEDLDFARETGEFIVYEAEVIGYCANMSNMSNQDLLEKFMMYKSEEIIKETFNEGNGLEHEWATWGQYDANVSGGNK